MCELGNVSLANGNSSADIVNNDYSAQTETALLPIFSTSSFQLCDPSTQSCGTGTFQVPSVFAYATIPVIAVAGSILVRSGEGLFAVEFNMPKVDQAIEEGKLGDAIDHLRVVANALRTLDATIPESENEAAFWADTLDLIRGHKPKNMDEALSAAESVYGKRGDKRSLARVYIARARHYSDAPMSIRLYQRAIDTGTLTPREILNARTEMGERNFAAKKYGTPTWTLQQLDDAIPLEMQLGLIGSSLNGYRDAVRGDNPVIIAKKAISVGRVLLLIARDVDPRLAELAFAQAVSSSTSINSPEVREEAVLGMAEAALREGHAIDALAYSSWAKALLADTGDIMSESRADEITVSAADSLKASDLEFQAREAAQLNRSREAMVLYSEVVRIRAGEDRSKAGMEWERIGDELVTQKRIAIAMKAYLAADEYFNQSSSSPSLANHHARVLNILAQHAEGCGRLENAIELYKEEAEVRSGEGLQGVQAARRNVGRMYEELAAELNISANIGNIVESSKMLLEAARVARDLGEIGRADELYHKAFNRRNVAYRRTARRSQDQYIEHDRFMSEVARENLMMFADAADSLAKAGLYDEALRTYSTAIQKVKAFERAVLVRALKVELHQRRDALVAASSLTPLKYTSMQGAIPIAYSLVEQVDRPVALEMLGRVNEALGTSFTNLNELVEYAAKCGLLATADVGSVQKVQPVQFMKAVADAVIEHRVVANRGLSAGEVVARGIVTFNRSLSGETVKADVSTGGLGDGKRDGREEAKRAGEGIGRGRTVK